MKRTVCLILTAGLLASVTLAEKPLELPNESLGQGPIQVGEEVRLRFASEASTTLKSEGLTLVWQEELYMPFASYIAPHFSYFNLPRGAQLVVRAPDHSRSWTYTGFGKADHLLEDGFWGIHIPGEVAIVELYSRVPVPGEAVVIDSFAHGYPDYVPSGLAIPESEALCGPDDSRWAKCYQSSEPTIYGKSRAVARLLINGTGACTGWLVGSQGHLMTNNHCIGTSSSALNTNYEFMAEGACSTNCASWFACPGTVVATSATLIKTNVNLDYTLVRLPTNVSGTYGFLQLRQTGAVNGERIYISGHPQGWGKRLSVASSHPSNPSGRCEVDSLNQPACVGGSVGEVGYYCDTQGGSSGSPVLAYSDHCVVALHHCGICPNRGVKIQNIISHLGSSLPNGALCNQTSDVTVTFTSVAAHDGWVRESTETSNVGGNMNATATGAGALKAGDNHKDRQFKAIVSFNTAPIPNGATILSAKLRLRRGSVAGTNPFNTHGTCWVDLRKRGFGGDLALAPSDFQASPTVSRTTSLSKASSNGAWSEGNLNSAGRSYIHKSGHTQFRIYFNRDDNDDLSNDYIGYYSGNNSNSANHPQLVVTYRP